MVKIPKKAEIEQIKEQIREILQKSIAFSDVGIAREIRKHNPDSDITAKAISEFKNGKYISVERLADLQEFCDRYNLLSKIEQQETEQENNKQTFSQPAA